MKIMAVCGSGLGSSFIMEMKIKEVLTELGIDGEVDHTDLGSLTPDMADVFVCTRDLAGSVSVKNLISIPNITDKSVIKQELQNYINNK